MGLMVSLAEETAQAGSLLAKSAWQLAIRFSNSPEISPSDKVDLKFAGCSRRRIGH
jgi:hypothetical protein